MPATEEFAATPSAATGDNLAVMMSSNNAASVTAPIGKKRNNIIPRMNSHIQTSKSLKSQVKSQQTHPSYGNMIKAALLATQDKKGSSRAAILKYIMQNFAVGENPTMVNAHLRMGLKRGVASGVLKQMKGTGASGSFRLVDAKSEPPKKVKKSAVPKSATTNDTKVVSPKKSMKAKSSPKKVAAPKTSKLKTASKKAKSLPTEGARKNKKTAGRPKKAKASAVKKSKTEKKSTVAYTRNKTVAV